MNMVPMKSTCAIQEGHRSSIEDLSDSSVSCSEEHDAFCDEGAETVFWSNAAFRTSLSSSFCSNQEEGFSPRNSVCQNLAYRDCQKGVHQKNPIHCFSEKSVSVNFRGNLSEISAQGCYKMIKVEAQLKSPVMEQSSVPHKSTELSESNGKCRALPGLNNGMIISEEEVKIKAELEKEIEKALEEEIKDGILVLTQRLAHLHARQKVRKEDCQYHKSEFNTPLKSYNGALQDSNYGLILYPKLPKGTTSPLGLSSSSREKKSSAHGNEGRHFKSLGNPKDPEKKFHKDFDWVRTLRSGAKLNSPKKSNHRLAEHEKLRKDSPRFSKLNSPKNPNHSLADHEKLRNDSPRSSRALFSEPINEKRCSTSELPLHGKFYAKLSPKDELCSTEHIHTAHSAVSRKVVSREGNDAVEEAKPVCQDGGKPKENRLLLIDMMNKLRASNAYNVGEQSKRGAFYRKQASSSKGLVRNATNAMQEVKLEEDCLMV